MSDRSGWTRQEYIEELRRVEAEWDKLLEALVFARPTIWECRDPECKSLHCAAARVLIALIDAAEGKGKL